MNSPLGGHLPWAPPAIRLDQLLSGGRADRPAVTFKSETVTYGELALRVGAAAEGLRALGIRRGDRVAVYMEKRVETIVALLAVSRTGAVLVPVNPLFKARHLRHVVADCAARTVITTTERLATVDSALGEASSVEHVVLANAPEGAEEVFRDGRRTVPWHRLCAAEAGTGTGTVAEEPPATDRDVAAIFYTSGSTGGPKGVVLSHGNLIAGAESVAGYLGHTADDVVLSVLPLSFDAGFSQLTTSLIAGAHLVLVNYLVPGEAVRLCARHQVTALTCVPPLWMQLAAQKWPEEATASLRYFANTGGRLPRSTLATLRGLFPQASPYLMYGLTEAFRSTYLAPEEVDRRPDSIGKAIPNAEVLVVRPDGSECGPDETGELVHRGPLVALGYWNAPERTAERFRPVPGGPAVLPPEPAVWSGDLVRRDEEGFLYFVGRGDDMIKTSGYRVSPAEVEEAVYATGLTDQAVALGVEDGHLGHHIVLVFSGGCDPEVLRKALAQELPPYMLPRRTVALPSLPLSPNGKFDRVAVRQEVER
ncbi:acyl-CoA ligase (AMP-forming), exosortase A system-associated [Streptomyces sp. TBY4]|uniref:acyl-CoA ligase (AMP-forming), exosortase A system-associated n=1 Tax=Streptomyces sp. TBY4 TaxID=2962030 RepID=UPI0020B85154|nr:acyl-CoA ligase (AMP-forming), exosortase A system-associated [Streptomyces sp. TBY4]MCP3760517.1 acyl-CoA ligase (AMP-forming), exosortase A system-associated [Streptomyces sp. TBY4]